MFSTCFTAKTPVHQTNPDIAREINKSVTLVWPNKVMIQDKEPNARDIKTAVFRPYLLLINASGIATKAPTKADSVAEKYSLKAPSALADFIEFSAAESAIVSRTSLFLIGQFENKVRIPLRKTPLNPLVEMRLSI